MKAGEEIIIGFLRDVIYRPETATLNIEELPLEFRDIGTVLQLFSELVIETSALAKSLSKGDLDVELPPRNNEIAAPLKALHSSLKHLTWQTQQIALGDYNQRVEFMGEFADAFNTMVAQLAQREKKLIGFAYIDTITGLYNRNYGMNTLDMWLHERKQFALIFCDLDSLKYINDKYGHGEGDLYISNTAKHLLNYSSECFVCRVGGDEFMLLAENHHYHDAYMRMRELSEQIEHDPYLNGKNYTYSLSYGICVVEKDNALTSNEILSIADERMYEHKRLRKKSRKGKNPT